MAKRRRSTRASDDGFSQDNATDGESDYSDASFTVTPKQRNKRATKRARDATNTNIENVAHPKAFHSIREPATIRAELLQWYETVQNKRGMPWRKTYDPNLDPQGRAQRAYEVWVSEIMLQQTQVATVIPYYNRWMAKFPTIIDLANATVDEVNALWKGLGYYSRASRLLQGAQKVVNELSGMLPDNARDLEAQVPGIGRYSAGAISSIAYGERVPAVDGNVQRVMSRLLALHANPKAKSSLDILWSAAGELVETNEPSSGLSAQHAGDVNQALIELGSTICKVSPPSCASCPLKTHCIAYEVVNNPNPNKHEADITDLEDICRICEPFTSTRTITAFPMKAERKKAREEIDIVNVVEWREMIEPPSRHFLMVKRPERGLLAGLYEFPSFADVSTSISQETVTAEILSKLQVDESHLTGISTQSVGDVLHIFSHIKKTYRAYWVVLESTAGPPPEFHFSSSEKESAPAKKYKSKKAKLVQSNEGINTKWVSLEEVDDMNMGTGVTKVWKLTKRLWE